MLMFEKTKSFPGNRRLRWSRYAGTPFTIAWQLQFCFFTCMNFYEHCCSNSDAFWLHNDLARAGQRLWMGRMLPVGLPTPGVRWSALTGKKNKMKGTIEKTIFDSRALVVTHSQNDFYPIWRQHLLKITLRKRGLYPQLQDAPLAFT